MGDVKEYASATKQYESQVHDQKKFGGHTLRDDLTALALTDMPATRDEVMEAWRAVVKASPPNLDMDALKQRRDRVLEAIERVTASGVNQPTFTACIMCHGTGRLRTRFGEICPSCNGTGHRTT